MAAENVGNGAMRFATGIAGLRLLGFGALCGGGGGAIVGIGFEQFGLGVALDGTAVVVDGHGGAVDLVFGVDFG